MKATDPVSETLLCVCVCVGGGCGAQFDGLLRHCKDTIMAVK